MIESQRDYNSLLYKFLTLYNDYRTMYGWDLEETVDNALATLDSIEWCIIQENELANFEELEEVFGIETPEFYDALSIESVNTIIEILVELSIQTKTVTLH